MKTILPIFVIILVHSLSSCTVSRRSMRESNFQLWLNRSDIEYTEQISAEATQTKVLYVDWKRLFSRKWDYGGVGDLPADPFHVPISGVSNVATNFEDASIIAAASAIIGINNISRTEQFAIANLIKANPGYDVIMFPQFELHRQWFVVGSKTKVVVRARLGKIKPSAKTN
jgi:predicted DNA-binding ArsR family transcriptional regulator